MDRKSDKHEADVVDLGAEGVAEDGVEQEAAGAETAGADKDASVELTNKLLRLQADFDNYRKRTALNRAEAREDARRELLLDLLPVYDNFLRAMEHADATEDYGSLREGILGIMRQLEGFFAAQGLVAIDSGAGVEFDPNLHDALGMVEGAEDQGNTIAQEILRGFVLNGVVVRPAQVMVFGG